MSKIVPAIFIGIFFSFPLCFYGQSTGGEISGKVLDTAQNPIANTAITLVYAKDSTIVKLTLTDSSGRFIFKGLKSGDYVITVSLSGFEKYNGNPINIGDRQLIVSLPGIILKPNAAMLKGVEVVRQKVFVEIKVDRVVLNVDALISNAGTNALDMLGKSPGVLVDQNGSISLNGKGVTIYIDDKPTYLSGADLANYLRSLPSSALGQVEIMTNPPARYEAAGNGGIINIKTKKGKLKGFNGTLNLSYGQGIYSKTINSLNFNYRYNKFNLFGIVANNTQNDFNDLNILRAYQNPDGSLQSSFKQYSFIKFHNTAYNSRIGLDYYKSDKVTFGILVSGLTRPSTQNNESSGNLSDANNQVDSIIAAHNRQNQQFKNGAINLNFRKEFEKPGKSITADIDFVTYKMYNSQSFVNDSYNAGGTLVSRSLLTGKLPSNIHIYTEKSDYTVPLKKEAYFSSGFKVSYTRTDNVADYQSVIGSVATPDYTLSNHFIYKENINAAYVNLSKVLGRLSAQAGLRLENTDIDGHQLGNAVTPDSSFKNAYTNLFPTVYFNYKLDTNSTNQIGMNFGRRISRPYFQDLNPFVSPLDKYTYYAGNPFLKPAFSDNAELSYTFKSRIITTLSYSSTSNFVSETIQILNGNYYSRPGNIGRYITKGISVFGNFDPAKWLSLSVYSLFTNIHSKSPFYSGELDTDGNLWYINANIKFKFGKDWTAEADGFYRSAAHSVQFISAATRRINLGLQKIISSKVSIRFNINDLFYTQTNNGIINNLVLATASYRNASDTRFAAISLSYKFGKAIGEQRKHETTGAEAEQGRVKSN